MLIAELIRRDRVGRRFFAEHEVFDEEVIAAVFDYMAGDGEAVDLPVAAQQLDDMEPMPQRGLDVL